MKMKAQTFAGKYHTPDAEDPSIVNHLDWYEATGFTRPYPGEKRFSPRAPSRKLHPPKSTPTSKSRSGCKTPSLREPGEGVFVYASNAKSLPT
jgi:hypothetical protein